MVNTAFAGEISKLHDTRDTVDTEELGLAKADEVIIGERTGLAPTMQLVNCVAATDVPVLILGESGAGKEVVAKALHKRSLRAEGPLVKVNCGAIPPDLVDSELFGHERGSFTGAVATRKGWFERADGGTLFLDEVGELPPAAQVRLLRVLQDGIFERVGGQRALSANVRIVAATHRDLQDMSMSDRFRHDLWYRISVFPIELPPLRDRPDDIPPLARYFAASAGVRLTGKPLVPSVDDIEVLVRQPWRGNVRELAAVIDRAAILGHGQRLKLTDALGRSQSEIPPPPPKEEDIEVLVSEPWPSSTNNLQAVADHDTQLDQDESPKAAEKHVQQESDVPPSAPLDEESISAEVATPEPTCATPSARSLEAVVVQYIEEALASTRGRIEGKNGAAALLGINPHTLRSRMRKLGIDWVRFRIRNPVK
jgi:hydrogenase-4 transcriptional activator